MTTWIDRSGAVRETHTLLVDEYGPSLITPHGDQVIIIEDEITEYPSAWLVPFNTEAFLFRDDFWAGLLPCAALIPKDPTRRPHYPPTVYPVEEYLDMLDTGASSWPRR